MQEKDLSGSAATQGRTGYRWVTLAMLVIFNILTTADRANIAVCMPMIKKEFALTNMQLGSIVSSFFLGYALLMIPAGFFVSKFGTRIVTSVSIVLFSFFTFLIGVSPSVAMMKIARLGLGTFEGPAGVGGGATLKPWFPRHEQGMATGFYTASNQIAFMLVPPVCVAIASHFGWRAVFYAFSVPGVLFGLLWAFVIRNRPDATARCNEAERRYIAESGPGGQSARNRQVASMGWIDTVLRVRRGMTAIDKKGDVFKSWNIWANCFVFFFFGLCFYGILTWIPSYLVNEKHYSFIKMGWLAALPFLGGLLGATSGGWISDKVWKSRRKPIMILGSVASVIMMCFLANAPADATTLGLILFLAGIAVNSPLSQYISYSMGLTTAKTYPLALAMVATTGTLGGLASPLLTGYLLDTFKSFTPVFYYFGISMAISLVFVFTLTEPLETVEPK